MIINFPKNMPLFKYKCAKMIIFSRNNFTIKNISQSHLLKYPVTKTLKQSSNSAFAFYIKKIFRINTNEKPNEGIMNQVMFPEQQKLLRKSCSFHKIFLISEKRHI